jgi:hypothetical protein
MATKHRLHSDPAGDPEVGALVRIIELKSAGENGGLEKATPHASGHRLKHQQQFPWRVMVPLAVSPRLRGLILLNMVSVKAARAASWVADQLCCPHDAATARRCHCGAALVEGPPVCSSSKHESRATGARCKVLRPSHGRLPC